MQWSTTEHETLSDSSETIDNRNLYQQYHTQRRRQLLPLKTKTLAVKMDGSAAATG